MGKKAKIIEPVESESDAEEIEQVSEQEDEISDEDAFGKNDKVAAGQ